MSDPRLASVACAAWVCGALFRLCRTQQDAGRASLSLTQAGKKKGAPKRRALFIHHCIELLTAEHADVIDLEAVRRRRCGVVVTGGAEAQADGLTPKGVEVDH